MNGKVLEAVASRPGGERRDDVRALSPFHSLLVRLTRSRRRRRRLRRSRRTAVRAWTPLAAPPSDGELAFAREFAVHAHLTRVMVDGNMRRAGLL